MPAVGSAAVAVAVAVVAAECLVVLSVDKRCQPSNSMRRLEHLRSLQHRRPIAPRLNNRSIRVWLAVAEEMEVCAERWICVPNRVEAEVGFSVMKYYFIGIYV
jgi:hypothetical protein